MRLISWTLQSGSEQEYFTINYRTKLISSYRTKGCRIQNLNHQSIGIFKENFRLPSSAVIFTTTAQWLMIVAQD
jgi:hypothetical protein